MVGIKIIIEYEESKMITPFVHGSDKRELVIGD